MEKLPGEAPRSFDKQSYVDFQRFKRDFQGIYEKCGLDALVIWTQIRSFIKGSVEALRKPGATKVITMNEYLDFVKFGAARCRLPKQQRETAYEIFVKYEKEKERLSLWDDCDLMTAIHAKFDESKLKNKFPEELYYDKLYVDEVQDYTQSEIALFFKLCRPGNLFLAGVSELPMSKRVGLGICRSSASFGEISLTALFSLSDFQDAAQAVVGTSFQSNYLLLAFQLALLSLILHCFRLIDIVQRVWNSALKRFARPCTK